MFEQCGRCADPVFANFRYDEICAAVSQFKEKGLTAHELLKFQKCVAAVYPWNSEYDDLRFGVNRRFNVFPLVIIMAYTKEDVLRAYAFAQRYDIGVCARSGAHSVEGWSLCSGMIIDQSHRIAVRLDKKRKVAIAEPGVLLGPLASALTPHHLCFSSGSCANNGLAGFTLGGGLGLFDRQLGMNCDSLLSVEILLANGDLVRANAKEHSDLYWACRGGGGGNFGIVTEFELQVYEYTGFSTIEIVYSLEDFKEVLKAWQEWAPFTDERLSTEFRATSSGFKISGVFFESGDQEADQHYLENLLQPVLIGNKPVISIKTKQTFVEAVRTFAGKGRWPLFTKAKNSFITQSFPDEALDIMIDFIQRSDGLDVLELNACGGKINALADDETAFPHRQGVTM